MNPCFAPFRKGGVGGISPFGEDDMQHFDLMVLGSGSGLEVSSEAAGLGLSVAIIEEGPFGGT